MTVKTISWITGLVLSSLFAACSTNINSIKTSVRDRGELVVAMDVEMPGYFVLGGESYGYQYDLLKAYADYLNVDLRVIGNLRPSQYEKMLSNGEVDLVATLSNHVKEMWEPFSVPVYKTSYVMLTGKSRAASVRRDRNFDPVSSLEGSNLLLSSGFKGSKVYHQLLDSLSSARIFISSKNSFELIEKLADGQYDYLICEQSEAQLGCALVRRVEQVWNFSEEIALSAVVSPYEPELKHDFVTWLNGFRNSEEYAVLNDLYFDKGIVYQFLKKGVSSRTAGIISPYDKMIKRICEEEGYDWRLISAIVYNESRFNPHVISSQGAKGLMQIMPRVAQQFNAEGDIMDPEKNVLLGLKILNKIEKSLKFSPNTPVNERMKIILACYNGGIGHVKDARNLAVKYGGNPDRWEDVSTYLQLKGTPEYISDEVVKCGSFNGRETLAFVDNVYSKYYSYCSHVKL